MRRALLVAAALLLLAACEREKRRFEPPPPASSPAASRASPLQPGASQAQQSGQQPPQRVVDDEDNAWAVNQGKRLFRWYNCAGCHSPGAGGNMGPPLMDEQWLYGARPADIYKSIVEGRPNGMPSFGGRIPDDQLWQIVAYVRSTSGQLRKDVAPSRGDTLAGAPPENTREMAKSVPANPPSAPSPNPSTSAAMPASPALAPASAPPR